MNHGLIVGQVSYNGRPADMNINLARIEGSSEMNVGRGVTAAPRDISLYTMNETPYAFPEPVVRTNSRGGFALWFKWDFLGSSGIPNDTRPFFHAIGIRFIDLGGNVPQTQGVTVTRRRGLIMNSPRTVVDLMGVNVPIEGDGAVSMSVDLVSIMRNAGVSTLPSPLVGRTFMETQMFIGVWIFEAN